MQKFIVLFLFALIAVSAASEYSVDAEIESDVADVEPIEMVEETVAVDAKMSMTMRSQLRADLKDMWATNNLDMELISEQELIETKTGKGYGEMSAIMVKVDELEKKIQKKIVVARKKNKVDVSVCNKNKRTINSNIARLTQRIKNNEARVVTRVKQIKDSDNKKVVAATRITRYQKQVKETNYEKDADVESYSKRKNKRMKEINVLRKAMKLVCTFTDFLKSETCKVNVVGRDLANIEPVVENKKKVAADVAAADAAIEKYEKEFKKTIKENAAKIEEGKAVIPKVAITVKKTDTAETLFGFTTDELKTHRASLVAELETLLGEDDFVSSNVAKPCRMAINFAQTGETASKEDPGSLPVLLWELFSRITSEMKREAADMIKLLADYQKRTDALQESIFKEVSSQKAENEAQIGFNRDITASQNDISIAKGERLIQSKAKKAEYKRCYDLQILYRQEQKVRYNELTNIGELRSLLRVLQNSDLPKCKNDCTDAKQGKCIWKGLFGKDSYCRCSKEYYGSTCENKKCPGDTGLLQHNQRGVCNNNGSCNPKTGVCTCNKPYFHGSKNACEKKHCPGSNDTCGGPSRGKCNTSTGTCECTTSFHGSTCQYQKCPGTNNQLWMVSDKANVCHGERRGACDVNSGKCKCGSMNYGSSCQYWRCKYSCNGRGACNASNGTCACNAAYTGTYCERFTCPNNCRGAGRCLPNGKCDCNHGRVGNDCRAPGWCEAGNTRVFYNQGYMRWWDCPSGYLLTGFSKVGTALTGLQYFFCAKPCDENSSSFARYTSNPSYCVNANWWSSFDRAGWSQCGGNRWVAGLRKNHCNNLYCIEEARCCSISSTYWGACHSLNWSRYMNSYHSQPKVMRGAFITGFYRHNGWGYGLNGIAYARACYYRH